MFGRLDSLRESEFVLNYNAGRGKLAAGSFFLLRAFSILLKLLSTLANLRPLPHKSCFCREQKKEQNRAEGASSTRELPRAAGLPKRMPSSSSWLGLALGPRPPGFPPFPIKTKDKKWVQAIKKKRREESGILRGVAWVSKPRGSLLLGEILTRKTEWLGLPIGPYRRWNLERENALYSINVPIICYVNLLSKRKVMIIW